MVATFNELKINVFKRIKRNPYLSMEGDPSNIFHPITHSQ